MNNMLEQEYGKHIIIIKKYISTTVTEERLRRYHFKEMLMNISEVAALTERNLDAIVHIFTLLHGDFIKPNILPPVEYSSEILERELKRVVLADTPTPTDDERPIPVKATRFRGGVTRRTFT